MTAPDRSGRRRILLALGAFVVGGAALSAAALTDSADVLVTMDGSQNRFDIQVSGRYGDDAIGWSPRGSDWAQGNPDSYRLDLGPGAELLSPGAHIDGTIAVLNASPRLAAELRLSIIDPVPRGDAVDPATGNRVELFDQLLVTVREGEKIIYDRIPAHKLTAYTWPEKFSAGAEKSLEVRIEMSPDASNEWQSAQTDVQFQFEAVTP